MRADDPYFAPARDRRRVTRRGDEALRCYDALSELGTVASQAEKIKLRPSKPGRWFGARIFERCEESLIPARVFGGEQSTVPFGNLGCEVGGVSGQRSECVGVCVSGRAFKGGVEDTEFACGVFVLQCSRQQAWLP